MTDVTASALGHALGDRYRLEGELGRGGMATVYLAHDLKHNREVALKLVRPDLGAVLGGERFLREIRLTAKLQHPHILPLLDSGEAAGQLFYVMPYVEGESLRQRIRREGQLPLDDAIQLGREVAEALDYAHEHGIIHRDIKPENILLSRGHALVADFGIALAATQAGGGRLTETGLSLGTPAYMSPEQATADPRVDGRSDQYSLACVVYEMLAGEPPYTGPTAQAITAKRLREPVPHLGTMRQVPQAVEDAVTRALARAPADRYPTVSQFAHALASASVSGAAGSAPLPRSRRLWWSSLAALALLTLFGGWWGASRTRTEAAMRSVALLPCENTGPGPAAAYIGDRWSEELIQKLVRIGGLNPNAWASVRRYRDSPLALQRIGAELHAGTLVRCQISELPTGTDLSVQLIRADDERVMWSNDYGRPPGADGINSAQATAARDIAHALGVSLPPRALASLERPLTRDTVALRLYRLGTHYLQFVDDPVSIRKGLDDFEGAIARDTSFAQAYVGLAEAMIWRGQQESFVSRDYFPAAAERLRRAIALDPSIAEAHSFLGRYLLDYTHDWAGALEEHRQALALNPNSVDAHLWYGWQLFLASRFDEATTQFRRAVDLDPTNPIARAQLIRSLAFAGDDTRALRELREALELWPEWETLYHHWAVMLLHHGQRDSALAVLDSHIRTAPLSIYGWLYAAAGRRDRGQHMLDSLLALNESRPVDPADIAAIEAGLGNTGAALDWLERAYAERSALLLLLLGPHPAFDALRGDPRFRELRMKAGFKN